MFPAEINRYVKIDPQTFIRKTPFPHTKQNYIFLVAQKICRTDMLNQIIDAFYPMTIILDNHILCVLFNILIIVDASQPYMAFRSLMFRRCTKVSTLVIRAF